MSPRHYLSVTDFSPDETLALLALAAKLKQKWRTTHAPSKKLRGQTLAALFEKSSLRTRTTFEAGMTQLGGHTIFLSDGVGLGTREGARDVARNLDRWVQIVAARVYKHTTLEELAHNSDVPVINALSDREHPCQILADLLTLQEHWGTFSNRKLAYIGDGNNVCHSLLLGCAQVGISITVASPERHWPHADIVEQAQALAAEHDATVTIGLDKYAAVQDADAIYTDVWASMGQEHETEARRPIFQPYQVDQALLDSTGNPATVIMHDLPAHRGEEITAEVLDGPRSIIYDQAENRLHAQKALILTLLGKA